MSTEYGVQAARNIRLWVITIQVGNGAEVGSKGSERERPAMAARGGEATNKQVWRQVGGDWLGRRWRETRAEKESERDTGRTDTTKIEQRVIIYYVVVGNNTPYILRRSNGAQVLRTPYSYVEPGTPPPPTTSASTVSEYLAGHRQSSGGARGEEKLTTPPGSLFPSAPQLALDVVGGVVFSSFTCVRVATPPFSTPFHATRAMRVFF